MTQSYHQEGRLDISPINIREATRHPHPTSLNPAKSIGVRCIENALRSKLASHPENIREIIINPEDESTEVIFESSTSLYQQWDSDIPLGMPFADWIYMVDDTCAERDPDPISFFERYR